MPKSSPSNEGVLLAVSGGIDSMLLAHIVAGSGADVKIAHFDHGLRPDSGQDEQLVSSFAKRRDIEFVSEKASLSDHSEDTARKARHEFLAKTADNSPVATAHHLDDLVESIAINLSRGTGWRGLAVLNRANYIRPLLTLEKSEIQSLARELGVKWREDSTNQSQKYLRNRLRQKTANLPFDAKWKLLKLRNRQIKIQKEIEEILNQGEKSGDRTPSSNRTFYTTLDSGIALELLRYALLRQNIRSTRPELQRLLYAIQTYEPGKKLQLSGNKFVLLRRHDFIVLD